MITDRNKKHITETIPAATVVDSESEDMENEEEEMEEERKTNDKQLENNDKKFHLVCILVTLFSGTRVQAAPLCHITAVTCSFISQGPFTDAKMVTVPIVASTVAVNSTLKML